MNNKKTFKEREAARRALGITDDLLDSLIKQAKDPKELFGSGGPVHQLKGALMNRMLQAEMDNHLGYKKHQSADLEQNNRRNGHSEKTLQTESGPTTITVPRDRDGTFEPVIVPKHHRRLEGSDDKVLALYSRGLSMRDIQSHLYELYGTDVSPELISAVTDAVIEELRAWQSRPLESIYPVVYLDALFIHVKESSQVIKKAVYVALGVTLEGNRQVLGLWIQQNEGAKFWLSILTDLKNRGVDDIFFICCDGLSGFAQAIETAFPKTVVQTCIVHMIRNSLKYVSEKDKKIVATDLKSIYTAENQEAAARALDAFDDKWSKSYPTIAKQWRSRWNEIIPFLAYPQGVRKILYTTNAIESMNYQLRKVTKTKGHFPNDDAVLKLLYLAIQNAQTKWRPSPFWKSCLAHFAIMFEGRFPA